jgi:hypothetical protein
MPCAPLSRLKDKIMRKKTAFSKKPKEKIGTILDAEVVNYLREKSAREGRAISDVIQEAVLEYEGADAASLETRLAAARRFCSKPFKLSSKDINEILGEDPYEQ